jgi:hypothetical protein
MERGEDVGDSLTKWYKRLHPMKMLTIFIYCALPFFQRPAWCLIADAKGIIGKGANYWHC